MTQYVNGLNLNLNEVAVMDFMENSQFHNGSVVRVAMLYDTLKLFHKLMGEAIEQHDAKLHQLQRSKDNMN